MLRKTQVHIFVCCFCAPIWSTACASEPPINALWNDGEGFGIWLYNRPGACSEFQYKHPPFVVVGNGGKRSEVRDGMYGVPKLEVCVLMEQSDMVPCASGSIRIHYVPSTNQYVGEYNFKLSNKKTWSGSFRAQYCKSP